jgi:FkbH-like protein
MAEAVRLVIWDLDETFWKGTVTEGGITEYVQAHHDVVIALARRGIMSSICSKNDREPILKILQEKGIADYFVFPSINWEAKGPRLASLIETIQLRPATVMFIDDNPGNRGEAARFVPDLQIEDEHFIARLLDDPRFKGKGDEGLSRLAQYKLLEQRKRDEQCASGDNEEFLRSCDIRVHIEYDVLPHIDRVIELINRTNQLNFTKLRLTEDTEQAREQLIRFFTSHWHQSGLVRVADKYGDYGFVGFFMVRNGLIDVEGARLTPILLHYCFSCRTLGMQIETWLYRYLKRPRLTVVGDVLTDIFNDRDIDWIRLVSSMDESAVPTPRLAPEIRLHGGCDITSVGHYLNASSDSMVVTGNFHAGVGFVRLNGASLLLSACDRRNALFREEAAALRIPYEMMVSYYFDDAPAGAAFVFGGQYDCYGPGRWKHHRYRHKKHGWEIRVEPEVLKIPDLTLASMELIAQRAEEAAATPEKKADAGAMAAHVRMHYESIDPPSDADLKQSMEEIFTRLPVGSKLVVMLDHNQMRMANGSLQDQPWVDYYNMMIRSIAAAHPFVAVVCYSEFIRNEDEIRIGGNHYDRTVYKRMSEAILGALREVPAKGIGARYVRGPSALPASLSKPHAAIETGSGQVPELWRDVSAIIAVKTMLIAAEK